MKTINLKKYYYPICKKDTFVEVPDEVADAIVEASRAEDANDAKQHYHCYSLDASPGMENHFPEQAVSPEDILMEKETEREQEAARALMMERLREALATLTPRQASCLHARFWEGKQFKEIAEAEGFTTYATILANEDRSKELRQPRPSVREHLKQEPKQAAPKAPGHKKREPER